MRKKKRRSVYLLPNLLTSMSLFGGFYAMVATVDRRFTQASIAIFLSCILDALDGRVARMTHSTSRFGVEYDSLSDVIAFGVAPGFLVYMWALKGYGRFGWLAAFLYVACGALRLARFNVQAETVQKKHFLGLPIPAAAAAIAASVLFFGELHLPVEVKKIFAPILMYALGFLMVSAVRYSSFKESSAFRSRHFEAVVAVILLFVIVLIEPAIMLFAITMSYMLSGPVFYVFKYIFKRKTALVELPRSRET
jgi:CDP-diacylglycerol--serine O-phosphatidyltransferase